MVNSEDISDVFTKEGIQKLKKNQLLRFNFEGSLIEFIITHINKKSGKVRAKRTTTYDQTQVAVEDTLGNKTAFNRDMA